MSCLTCFWFDCDVVGVLADILAPGDDIMRVLIDIEADLEARDGGGITPWQELLLRVAGDLVSPAVIMTVAVPPKLEPGVARRFSRLPVVRAAQLDGQFDIAFAPGLMNSPARLSRRNRLSSRWVLTGSQAAAEFAEAAIDDDRATSAAEALSTIIASWGSPVDIERLRDP